MRGLLDDLRYCFRTLRKSPGFALAAIVTLTLGIGANTAIFTAVNAYLIRPLPFPHAERLAVVQSVTDESKRMSRNATLADEANWKRESGEVEDIAAYRSESFNLTGGGVPERVRGIRTTPSLLEMLGVSPVAGRLFFRNEDKPEAAPVALLGEALWLRRFGGSPEVVGQTIQLTGKSYTVVGIVPATLVFPERDTAVWLPMVHEPAGHDLRAAIVLVRLKSANRLAAVGSEFSAIIQRAATQASEGGRWRVTLLQLHQALTAGPRQSIDVLFSSVFFVLLIACVNVANLQLARAASRQKEAAVRAALGASRIRLMRPLLLESLVLSLIGGAAGLFLGYSGMRLLAVSLPAYMRPMNEVVLDSTVLFYTLAVCAVTSAMFGLAPALRLARADTSGALKEGSRGSSSGRKARLGRMLVVSEIACAVILLIGAALLIKAFGRLQADPGFRPDRLLTASISLPDAKYPEASQREQFFRQLLARLQAQPAVESASAVNRLQRGAVRDVEIDGRAAEGNAPQFAGSRSITPDYFRTMGIALLRGRTFSDGDSAGTTPVVIVNQTLARRYWPDRDPLGRTVRTVDSPSASGVRSPGPWLTVVGVVSDDRQNLMARTNPEMYVPQWQQPSPTMAVVVRSSGAPSSVAAALRSAVLELDSDQPISAVESVEQMLVDSIGPHRVTTMFLAIFAAIAIFLATVGIYGVISYSVSQRTQEIGVRIALGARRVDVLGMVLGEGMRLTVIGVAVGLAAAFGVTRALSAFLFGVSATDGVVFSAVPLLFAAVAAAATLLPARRASLVDPNTALRMG